MSGTAVRTRALHYPELLEHRASTEPDAVAIRRPRLEQLTFAAWLRRSRAHASELIGAGWEPGTRIGLLFDGPAYVDCAVAMLGALTAGAAVAPLSRALTDAELSRATARAELDLIVHARDVTLPPALGSRAFAFVADDPRTDVPLDAPAPSPRDDALAEILFTSGTTGTPKVIGVTCAGMAAELPIELGSGPRGGATLHAVPLGTNWGQVMVRQALARRATTIVMDRFDAEDAAALIAEERPVELALSPLMARLLIDAEVTSCDLSSLRQISLSSAPVDRSLFEGLRALAPRATIAAFYSSTEACPAQTELFFPADPPVGGGRPSAGSELRVVGRDGRVLASGEIGEVQLRTTRALPRVALDGSPLGDDDGWIAPGDLGRIDADGFLTLVGRQSEVISVGGLKVHGPEVSAALLEHPAVREAVAFAVPAPATGEEVAAVVVSDDDATVAELPRFARSRLAVHKRPARIERIERLPRTAAGKVDVSELRRWLSASPVGRSPAEAPTGEVERHLLELWRELLDEQLSATDELATHGAGSLEAFAVLSGLRQRLGVTVPAGAFLRCPTVAAQARLTARTLATA